MAEYITEQKTMLLTFLRSNHDNAFTVDELTVAMNTSYGAKAPGKSTIYRLITKLSDDGVVKKFAKTGSRCFVYQIVGEGDCHNHLHLKCLDCGKLIHLDEEISEELLDKVKMINDFSVNEDETVLLGKCAECKIYIQKKEIK